MGGLSPVPLVESGTCCEELEVAFPLPLLRVTEGPKGVPRHQAVVQSDRLGVRHEAQEQLLASGARFAGGGACLHAGSATQLLVPGAGNTAPRASRHGTRSGLNQNDRGITRRGMR